MPVEPPEGPGFEPLISRPRNAIPSRVKRPQKEYSIMIRERRGVASHARESSAVCGRRGPIRAVRRGRAFSGGSLGQTKRRGRWLTDGIVQQSRRARRLPCRIYCCVRAWETLQSWGPSRQRQHNLPHSMRSIRAVVADPPVTKDKNEREGVVLGTPGHLPSPRFAFSASPAS